MIAGVPAAEIGVAVDGVLRRVDAAYRRAGWGCFNASGGWGALVERTRAGDCRLRGADASGNWSFVEQTRRTA